MIDDSPQKCAENNYFNCIHPLPYAIDQDHVTVENKSSYMLGEHSILGDKNQENIDDDISSKWEDNRINIDSDTELNPVGKLSNYLVSLSENLKNNENSLTIDKRQSNETNIGRPKINCHSLFYIINQIGRYDFNV